MKISVIIPTFNRAHMLPCAIHSILKQSRTADEIVVVDDGGTDNTENVCAEYSNYIKYFKKSNGGKSSALNLGLRQAIGDVVYILDDDDVALRHTLRRHEQALKSSPEAAFSYGPLLHGSIDDTNRARVDRRPRLASYEPACLYVQQLIDSDLVQPCIAFRRRSAEAIGGFDEKFIRSQDYDFILRLAYRYSGVKIRQPVFIQRQHCGLRGSTSTPIPHEELRSHWRAYDRMAVAKQLKSIRIQDLAITATSHDLAPAEHREALLRKAVIEFRCGNVGDGLQSIRSATSGRTQPPLTPTEYNLVDMLLNSTWTNSNLLRSPLTMAGFPRAFRGSAGYEALCVAAKRMRWRAAADLRVRRIYEGIMGGSFSAYLLCYATIRTAVKAICRYIRPQKSE